MTKVIKCEWCGKDFERPIKSINQRKKAGLKSYCSMQCVAKSKIKSVTLSCATCGKAVKATPKRLKTTKSGKVYCSRSCAITTNNIDVVRNFKNGQSVYRSKALKHYGPKCSVCSYDTVRVLEVHHRDENRENNQIDNLDVLCPTHHTEYQVGIRTYAGVAKR